MYSNVKDIVAIEEIVEFDNDVNKYVALVDHSEELENQLVHMVAVEEEMIQTEVITNDIAKLATLNTTLIARQLGLEEMVKYQDKFDTPKEEMVVAVESAKSVLKKIINAAVTIFKKFINLIKKTFAKIIFSVYNLEDKYKEINERISKTNGEIEIATDLPTSDKLTDLFAKNITYGFLQDFISISSDRDIEKFINGVINRLNKKRVNLTGNITLGTVEYMGSFGVTGKTVFGNLIKDTIHELKGLKALVTLKNPELFNGSYDYTIYSYSKNTIYYMFTFKDGDENNVFLADKSSLDIKTLKNLSRSYDYTSFIKSLEELNDVLKDKVGTIKDYLDDAMELSNDSLDKTKDLINDTDEPTLELESKKHIKHYRLLGGIGYREAMDNFLTVKLGLEILDISISENK